MGEPILTKLWLWLMIYLFYDIIIVIDIWVCWAILWLLIIHIKAMCLFKIYVLCFWKTEKGPIAHAYTILINIKKREMKQKPFIFFKFYLKSINIVKYFRCTVS